jgi:lipopolysaccharide export system permease protein
MTKIDKFVLMRVGTRILGTVFVLFGLITLAESLDTWRFRTIADSMGMGWALVMVLASGARWTIKTLPISVLLGAIIGFFDLKVRHELTVIQSSGLSFWRIIRAPVAAVFVVALFISLQLETVTTSLVRDLAPMAPGEATLLTPPGEIWLEQRASFDEQYVLMARGVRDGGERLVEVTLFTLDGRSERIEAREAELRGGRWILSEALLRTPDNPPQLIGEYSVRTTSTASEVRLKLTSIEDVTFFELFTLIRTGISDPLVRAAALTRFAKLLSLPLTLVGSLLIAFAFTAGYRRHNNYGAAILYGMVLGFVVFVITEMSERAGAGGVIHPALAALGPAFVAAVIGVTVLLYREDGRV